MKLWNKNIATESVTICQICVKNMCIWMVNDVGLLKQRKQIKVLFDNEMQKEKIIIHQTSIAL